MPWDRVHLLHPRDLMCNPLTHACNLCVGTSNLGQTHQFSLEVLFLLMALPRSSSHPLLSKSWASMQDPASLSSAGRTSACPATARSFHRGSGFTHSAGSWLDGRSLSRPLAHSSTAPNRVRTAWLDRPKRCTWAGWIGTSVHSAECVKVESCVFFRREVGLRIRHDLIASFSSVFRPFRLLGLEL